MCIRDRAAEVERVVSTLRAGQEKQLRAAGVELIPYRAVVTGPHTVEAGGAAYEAAHILVAAGSEPALPPIPGLDTVSYTHLPETAEGRSPGRGGCAQKSASSVQHLLDNGHGLVQLGTALLLRCV